MLGTAAMRSTQRRPACRLAAVAACTRVMKRAVSSASGNATTSDQRDLDRAHEHGGDADRC